MPPADPSKAQQRNLRSQIPAMERILSHPAVLPLIESYGRSEVKVVVGSCLDRVRASGEGGISIEQVAVRAGAELGERHRFPLRRVVNATGVLIHTNLGRSPIDSAIWASAAELMRGYSNLEFDLESGSRGSRNDHLTALASRLFGCESAILTNNNAGAVLLVLAAIASGRAVIVSRGELVEIGGSFRIPDVIRQGGAELCEVGTTNRTRARDYVDAISERTGAILSVHPSNFQIVGFTESTPLEDLVSAARESGVPLVMDQGSGRVVDLTPYGLRPEPTVGELLTAGADVVTCSTDKLIGSVQGGLILGRKEIVDRCVRHPLMRALRVGRESYAITLATLQAFLTGRHETAVGLYRMLSTPLEDLRQRAGRIVEPLAGAQVVESRAAVGGGTTPTETIPSVAVQLEGKATDHARRLLDREIPIVGRIQEEHFLLDLRSVDPDEDELVIEALRSIEF